MIVVKALCAAALPEIVNGALPAPIVSVFIEPAVSVVIVFVVAELAAFDVIVTFSMGATFKLNEPAAVPAATPPVGVEPVVTVNAPAVAEPNVTLRESLTPSANIPTATVTASVVFAPAVVLVGATVVTDIPEIAKSVVAAVKPLKVIELVIVVALVIFCPVKPHEET